MKTVFKLLLMAVAYLAIFILGAASGAIHPACYAYIGALLPLLSRFLLNLNAQKQTPNSISRWHGYPEKRYLKRKRE